MISAYCLDYNTWTCIPRHVEEDFREMVEMGIDTVNLSFSENDMAYARRTFEILVELAHKAGLRVFVIPSRIAGRFAGAPLMVSTWLAQHWEYKVPEDYWLPVACLECMENLQKEDQSLYIIGKNAKEVELLESWCTRMQPELKMAGTCVYDAEMEDAALVNEINNHTPGILLVDLESGVQEQWIMEHVPLLHTRLCVAIGGVVGLILAEEKETPEWVKKLKLDSLYEKLVREQSVKKDMQARIFRKKVEQYNNQLEENEDERG